MIPIKYVRGDATDPQGNGTKLIIHCCNDVGAWGAGFVLALSKKWKQPKQHYISWCSLKELDGIPFELGNVQFVIVAGDLCVCNMIGQHGTYYHNDGTPPIRYDAIQKCLQKIRAKIEAMKQIDEENQRLKFGPYTVHAPRFGAGLAGGKWENIEALIKQELSNYDISVTIYDL